MGMTRFKGDPICHQHDISDSFYIIVKGSAIVTVDVKKKTDKGNEEKVEHEKKEMKHKEKEDDDDKEEEARPEQLEVARIETLGFFGEGALLTGGAQSFRNATVIVSSEKCQLLRLFQSKFQTFVKTSDLFSVSMMKSFQDTQNERNKSNSNAISKERSRKGLDVVTATNVTDSITDSATDSVTNSVTDSELVKVDDVNETVNEGKDVDQKVDDEVDDGKEEKKEKEEKEGVPKTSIIPIANDFSIASPPPPPSPLNLNGASKSERSLFS